MLTRWDPFAELDRWGRQLRRLEKEGTFLPAVDIYEDENEILLSAELPGVNAEDVNLELEGNLLTLRGERRFRKESREGAYQRIERSYGTFTRSFTLPEAAELDKIQADIEEGVLRVHIPKREAEKPRRVAVRAAGKGGKKEVAGEPHARGAEESQKRKGDKRPD